MGRGIRRNKNKPKNAWRQDSGKGWKDIVRDNPKFEEFYKEQGICSSEEEFQEMIEAFRKDLPTTFRVAGFRKVGQFVRKVTSHTGSQTKEIPWCPLAWQIPMSRKEIRKEESLVSLHNFLISETESGFISRQETVSMIPPLVLDVKSHHKVLDMCAAPGSKTAQIIEALHKDVDVDAIPKGFVVANDADNSRCYMLVHQIKRLQSPCALIVNNDASIFPNMIVHDSSGAKKNLKFDRILADVPCSGDGTLRKNADIWPKWSPHASNNLHGLQFRILKRGLELLEVGGRLVYSTCSLNPVEDEAVLTHMLKETRDTVRIVDGSSLVPGLKFKPGLTSWKIADKNFNIYSKFEDVPESMHTMRVLPHLQDTGGFFVAVLEKVKICPWESERTMNVKAPSSEDGNEVPVTQEPPKKKPRFFGYKEDPFMYFNEEEPVFEDIKKYFDIKDLDSKMFLTRCKDITKRNVLYYTSSALREIITKNEDRLKLINAGVKAFARCENKGSVCLFRLAQEGARMTLPFLGKRLVFVTNKDLEVLLFSEDVDKPPEITLFDEKTQNQFNKLDTGSVGFIFKSTDDHEQLRIELVGWKGKSTIRAYVPKNERIHYLRLIGSDTSRFEKNKFEERREKANDLEKENDSKE
ncbi:NSUN2 [Lepeophtheirus salmonis]|uniref:tRNA (cytosine(34)-C(5))-methyltransferase n=1 Tax=Lepeophtheirus salmonis TaxID=72036 RepID=A0A7R8H6A7_LEPSM|nr:NSUN2 [Lepeophtheirus salmonis]CAF2898258.1 NSUN2 [Lepeophtheirus salmonis]